MNPLSASASRITVSIVVHNSALGLLRKTLLSLDRAAGFVVSGAISGLDVTIVDNGSAPTYQQQLTALLDEFSSRGELRIDLLQLPVNLGFGAGHNRVLTGATGCYFLVLNPDVELDPDALALGCRRLQEDNSVVLLSPYAAGADGRQEFLCKREPSVLVLVLRAFFPGLGRRFFPGRMAKYEMSDVCAADAEVVVPLASGCFMLARSAQLREVGGFDERYFLYFEDFDLSLRLGRLGAVVYMPQLRIIHHGGYAARKGWRHLQMFMSSGLRFFRQHGWRWI
ncbi:glycosyltransferase family 2 protein [Pseudohalioglobus lutimaris]|uniref:Glycosyltransferase family 2 protein n=1 Tax=Pseudohalioglobus lutimaris TaxID=1737061 RepID=A0A2N5WWZ1_9GAMM|nr:glycosyltransferase family 2 protein [Pseudohalioglobus lutimaris]PLW66743.1 glycosyltransferase family 2 protein [Pseudohalioglobus lutimaris]